VLAAGLIALAMVWPQGYGARSPGPFGSTPIQQTAQMKAAMQREHAAAMRQAGRGRKARGRRPPARHRAGQTPCQ
jgi:hypothetical protein